MGFLGFLFDYGPKTFLDKTPRDILNMVSNKVTENFDEKYKDNELIKGISFYPISHINEAFDLILEK